MAGAPEAKAAAAQTKLAESAGTLVDSAIVQQDSADRRTQLAGDRTLLAAERTYAAWLRTGLAALAAGIGAKALLADAVAPWLATASAVVLILLAEFCFVAGVWRQFMRVVPPPKPDAPRLPDWLLIVFNGFLVLLGGAVLVGLAIH
ncbi:MAG: DUF202 domain-containing protein [Variovorax sp.]|nr:DUF202 domain-containing protein [Variovorax sp.]